MTPEELTQIVTKAVEQGGTFPWWSYVLSAAIGGLLVYLVSYLQGRGRHSADMEGKPLTASAVLLAENKINAKRDAYYAAIKVLSRAMASEKWSGPDVPLNRFGENDFPLESEVNFAVAQLSLFTDDGAIPEAYLQAFSNASPVSFGYLIAAMRSDLGYGELPFSPEKYLYQYKTNLKKVK